MTDKERALMVAEQAHGNQTYDIYPYSYHLRSVAKIAEDLQCPNEVIIAAYLHDILEDTSFSYNDVKKAFGEEVAEIVYCVTDELGRNRKERKEKTYPKIRSNFNAVLVKICDRIANINHSMDYNKDMLKLYIKEHNDFKENLTIPERGSKKLYTFHQIDLLKAAWEKLDKLMLYIDINK